MLLVQWGMQILVCNKCLSLRFNQIACILPFSDELIITIVINIFAYKCMLSRGIVIICQSIDNLKKAEVVYYTKFA